MGEAGQGGGGEAPDWHSHSSVGTGEIESTVRGDASRPESLAVCISRRGKRPGEPTRTAGGEGEREGGREGRRKREGGREERKKGRRKKEGEREGE